MKQIFFCALILLTITGCAKRLPEDELALKRERLEHYLTHAEITQSEMNIVSQNILELADMERKLLEYRIANQPNYDEIEEAFLEDCKAWNERAEAESKKPSEYEGGSLAPTDYNMRMTGFIEERIQVLRTKWRQK